MGQRMSKSVKYVFSKKYVLMFVFCLCLSGFRTVTLALNSSETGKLFVTKSFTFYNCTNFKS